MKTKLIYLLAAMMAAVAENDGILYRSEEKTEPKVNERVKSRILKSIQRPLNNYNINGVVISAPDKKTARKIYNNTKKVVK